MKTTFKLLTSGAVMLTALNVFSQNTTYGTGAGVNITSGVQNTFIGNNAGYSTTSGNQNTATGDSALYSNTIGRSNTATGSGAMFNNKSGGYNTAEGYLALRACSTASFNVAFGGAALRSNTANNNSAVGYAALLNNTSGTGNTGVGPYALSGNSTGNFNTGMGNSTLNSNTASGSSGFGYQSLYSSTTGGNNTAVGFQSGYTNTSGTGNTFVGYAADASAGTYSNSSAYGNGSSVTASNQVRLGNASVTSIGGYAGWTNLSDGRVKKDIRETVPGLAFIRKLRPVTYHLDMDKIASYLNRPDSLRMKDAEAMKGQMLQSGFIAQEVEKAAQELHFDFSGVDKPKNEKDMYGLRYAEFTVPLVKAVQEQQSMIDSLRAQLAQLTQLVKAIGNAPRTGHADNAQAVQLSNADVVTLGQNVPNPFSEQTIINYSIPQTAGSAQVLFYDQYGVVIKTIDIKTKGKGQLTVFASDLSSGLYSYTLVIDGRISDTKKMVKQ